MHPRNQLLMVMGKKADSSESFRSGQRTQGRPRENHAITPFGPLSVLVVGLCVRLISHTGSNAAID